MDYECLICCESTPFITVGKCEHKVVCLKCCLKLRSINRNEKCIYCNEELAEVAVVDGEFETFEEAQHNMKEFRHGIFFTNGRTKGACIYLNKFKCPVPNCKQ